MTKKLFRSSMLVAVAVMLLSIALFMGVLYQYFENQFLTELGAESALISRGIELAGEEYLTDLDTENRITWIGTDGTVLFDNVADATKMENHADREEVAQAISGDTGTATRYSSTLSERTLYFTRLLTDGSVIRVANAQYTIVRLLLSMLQPILLILALALILSAVLASRQSKSIIKPIVGLDLSHPEECDTYDELTPLLSRIKRQNDTITLQMEQLRRRQQEFSALTENMTEGFLLLDVRGRVLSYNSGALRLLNAPPPKDEVNVLVLNRSDPFRQAVERVLKGQGGEYRLNAGGRCCQLLANPVVQDGEVSGGVLVLLDVTEREQREELRREFTANVSHELKTPLTSISGIAEIMKNGMVKQQDVQGFADDIYQESQRLVALVEDIMRLSQLDEGAEAVQQEQVDLLALSKEIAHRLEATAEKADVSVQVAGEGGTVSGIRKILDQMIYNLCDNAIKYNRPGGQVVVSVMERRGQVNLSVADTGIGIPHENLGRVFERFYRVDKSHSKEIGGTGLGLSIVKHGAAFHEATVELDSHVDKGTTVSIRFPQK